MTRPALAPYLYAGRAVQVIDGDTCDLQLDLGFHVQLQLRVRLLGVDTPERGQPGFHTATGALRDLLFDAPATAPRPRQLLVATVKDRGDKYGRYLATLYHADTTGPSLNQQLLDAGHAQPYEGGTR